ncbi:hypothetical protein E4T66_17175 [Sinimarinibacterium sp. CAU 1509]|uniref:hypothetical protein n=1 Tax=Sinimarinibacterium sp. CAU 1509 TaxID=2562283 RepID=UPI0010AB90C5|nr:hypothetical protein [Sinimarinibacterium sp. CAU 1509]TJY57143.1 hypothetical protein E4T66_17175 [Sinimarinibacterium sp. CAU 1509]
MLATCLSDLRRSAHLLPPEIAEFIAGEAAMAAAERVDADDHLKARLTIRMLEGAALCAKDGSGVTDFIRVTGDTVLFVPAFAGFSNFVGAFSLPADDPLVSEVTAALARNLASPMAKAARAWPRVSGTVCRLMHARHHDCSKLFGAVQQQTLAAYPKPWTDDHFRSAAAAARVAAAAFSDRHWARLTRRVQWICDARTPGFAGPYTAAVAAFLCRELPALEAIYSTPLCTGASC